MGDCNETIVGLEQCRDLYGTNVDKELCEQLIDLYCDSDSKTIDFRHQTEE